MIELPVLPAHAKFAPSAASRWLQCNASVDFEDVEPREQFVIDAAQFGTDIHHIIATGDHNWPAHWDAEQRIICGLCIEEWCKHVPANYHAEVRLASKRWPALLFGTLDGLWFDNDESPEIADIADLKSGLSGVNANENAQLMVYSYLVLANYPTVKLVRAKIVQPRRYYVATCEYSREQLEDFEKTVAKAVESRAAFVAGPHCHYCPIRSVCPTLESYLFGLMDRAKELRLWTPTGLTITSDFCE